MSLDLDKEGVTALALASDGSRAFIGWSDGAIDVVDTATMQATRSVGSQAAAITAFALSPDGAFLAATDQDPATTIWIAAP